MKNINLEGTPLPHYLKKGNVIHDGAKIKFQGSVIFSSDDQFIRDRKVEGQISHVNVAHIDFATWNIGHHFANLGFLKPLIRVVKQTSLFLQETPLDKDIEVVAELRITEESKDYIKATASISYFSGGSALSTTTVKIVSFALE